MPMLYHLTCFNPRAATDRRATRGRPSISTSLKKFQSARSVGSPRDFISEVYAPMEGLFQSARSDGSPRDRTYNALPARR